MTRVGRIRLAFIIAAIGALEVACRGGLIDRRIVIAPSQMVASLASILVSGDINSDIVRTLGMIAAAVALSVVFGFALGLLVHALRLQLLAGGELLRLLVGQRRLQAGLLVGQLRLHAQLPAQGLRR